MAEKPTKYPKSVNMQVIVRCPLCRHSNLIGVKAISDTGTPVDIKDLAEIASRLSDRPDAVTVLHSKLANSSFDCQKCKAFVTIEDQIELDAFALTKRLFGKIKVTAQKFEEG